MTNRKTPEPCSPNNKKPLPPPAPPERTQWEQDISNLPTGKRDDDPARLKQTIEKLSKMLNSYHDECEELKSKFVTMEQERDTYFNKWTETHKRWLRAEDILFLLRHPSEDVYRAVFDATPEMMKHGWMDRVIRAAVLAAEKQVLHYTESYHMITDMKHAVWLLRHAAKQNVNEHRSMAEYADTLTRHIQRLEEEANGE